MAETFVLDSYAILALLGGEPGGEEVARLMRRAEAEDASLMMTWVNAGEVSYIVERRWGRDHLLQVLAVLEATALKMVPVERELALAGARKGGESPGLRRRPGRCTGDRHRRNAGHR